MVGVKREKEKISAREKSGTILHIVQFHLPTIVSLAAQPHARKPRSRLYDPIYQRVYSFITNIVFPSHRDHASTVILRAPVFFWFAPSSKIPHTSLYFQLHIPPNNTPFSLLIRFSSSFLFLLFLVKFLNSILIFFPFSNPNPSPGWSKNKISSYFVVDYYASARFFFLLLFFFFPPNFVERTKVKIRKTTSWKVTLMRVVPFVRILDEVDKSRFGRKLEANRYFFASAT